jgi:hypothetical protein
MYHCLDVERPQTVPQEKYFVQIDNTFVRASTRTDFSHKKQTRSVQKSFAAFLILQHASALPYRFQFPTLNLQVPLIY